MLILSKIWLKNKILFNCTFLCGYYVIHIMYTVILYYIYILYTLGTLLKFLKSAVLKTCNEIVLASLSAENKTNILY